MPPSIRSSGSRATISPALPTAAAALRSTDLAKVVAGWIIVATAEELLKRKGYTVYSVNPDQQVLEAIRLMAQYGIGALLVMQGEQLVGVVSERDYARKVILKGRSSSDTAVRQIMSAPVLTVRADQTVRECMEIMTARRVRHLPVVNNQRVIGVLSIGDLVRTVIEEQQRTIEQLEQYIHG